MYTYVKRLFYSSNKSFMSLCYLLYDTVTIIYFYLFVILFLIQIVLFS